jgi:hypothetical protein
LIDPAAAVDGNDGHIEAVPLQKSAGSEDCRMLDRTGDDVAALAPLGPGHPFEREVVGLAAAAGEDDLVRRAAKQRRDLAASFLEAAAPEARPRPLDGLPK